MAWIVPAINAGIAIYSAISGKKAAGEADKKAADGDRLRQQNYDLTKGLYDDWVRGEKSDRMRRIARLKEKGLSDQGILEKDTYLQSYQTALNKYRSNPNARASQFLGMDLARGGFLGNLARKDSIYKEQELEQEQAALRQGGMQMTNMLTGAGEQRAGAFDRQAAQYGAAANNAWSSVNQNMMALADYFAKKPATSATMDMPGAGPQQIVTSAPAAMPLPAEQVPSGLTMGFMPTPAPSTPPMTIRR